MCFIGGFSIFRTLTIVGTLGILLNAIYFLRAYRHMFLGSLNEKYIDLPDMSGREMVTLIPLGILVLWLGVYPAPLLNMIAPTMNALVDLIHTAGQ